MDKKIPPLFLLKAMVFFPFLSNPFDSFRPNYRKLRVIQALSNDRLILKRTPSFRNLIAWFVTAFVIIRPVSWIVFQIPSTDSARIYMSTDSRGNMEGEEAGLTRGLGTLLKGGSNPATRPMNETGEISNELLSKGSRASLWPPFFFFLSFFPYYRMVTLTLDYFLFFNELKSQTFRFRT